MTKRDRSPITCYSCRLLAGAAAGGLTDAELLERFVRQRDEAAFEVLVWRHGPKVLGVCRRTLGHEQDAEDAFQATFLVLAQGEFDQPPTSGCQLALPGSLSRGIAGKGPRPKARYRARSNHGPAGAGTGIWPGVATLVPSSTKK